MSVPAMSAGGGGSQEGVFRGLYAGISATLIFQGPATAIYFGTYEFVKKSARDMQLPAQYAPAVHLTAGAASEIANSVLVVPMEVVKSRLQLGENPHANTGGWIKTKKNYRNTIHAIISIVKTEGVSALYSGYRACLICDLRAAEDAEPLAGVARSVARELTANGSERVGRRDCNDRYWSSNSISNSRDRDRK